MKVTWTLLLGIVMLLGSVYALMAAETSPAGDTVAEVRAVGGVPTFVVDGVPNAGLSCMNYQTYGNPKFPDFIRQFGAAGCDIFTFVVDMGSLYHFTPTIWPEKDRWDFAQVDATAKLILDNAPPGSKIIVQLFIDTPEWWAVENPDECLVLEDGKLGYSTQPFALPRKSNFPSMASPKWREACKLEIEKLIGHISTSDYGHQIMGYQVCGQKTEEWYHWSMNNDLLGDYSPLMRRAFRDWLRAKYTTDSAMQSAWRNPLVTIDKAEIPSGDRRRGDKNKTFRCPLTECDVIDFHRFWSDIMADTISYFAKVVKDKTNHTKVVGGFYGYILEFAELAEDAGHLGLQRLLDSPDIDFVMAPSSYNRRDLKGGQSNFRLPITSLSLHGKMHWVDFDAASYKFNTHPSKAALQTWAYQLAITDTAEEFVFLIRRELGNALANGVNMVHFDLHGGYYYDDSTIMEAVKWENGVRAEALKLDRTSNAEILLLVDEDSPHYYGFRNPVLQQLMSQQQRELPFVAPFDTALLSDLCGLDTSRYKVVIFCNEAKLDIAQRRLIADKLKRDGKWLIWLHAAGLFKEPNGPASVANMADVTGIKVRQVPYFANLGGTFGKSFTGGVTSSVALLNGDQFLVEDPDAKAIARGIDAPHDALAAMRQFCGWTSVYSTTAPMPRRVLRWIAAQAGVHLYTDGPNDTLYANRSFVSVGADVNGGPRTIRLPSKRTVIDTVDGRTVCVDSDTFQAEFKPQEVRVYLLK